MLSVVSVRYLFFAFNAQGLCAEEDASNESKLSFARREVYKKLEKVLEHTDPSDEPRLQPETDTFSSGLIYIDDWKQTCAQDSLGPLRYMKELVKKDEKGDMERLVDVYHPEWTTTSSLQKAVNLFTPQYALGWVLSFWSLHLYCWNGVELFRTTCREPGVCWLQKKWPTVAAARLSAGWALLLRSWGGHDLCKVCRVYLEERERGGDPFVDTDLHYLFLWNCCSEHDNFAMFCVPTACLECSESIYRAAVHVDCGMSFCLGCCAEFAACVSIHFVLHACTHSQELKIVQKKDEMSDEENKSVSAGEPFEHDVLGSYCFMCDRCPNLKSGFACLIRWCHSCQSCVNVAWHCAGANRTHAVGRARQASHRIGESEPRGSALFEYLEQTKVWSLYERAKTLLIHVIIAFVLRRPT